MKKNYSFQHFGNFSTDPGRPAIKFFKNGLTCANIFPKKFENQQKVQFSWSKFAKDWKKLLKIVSLEKNLALQAQSLLWRLDLLANEDSNFGSMFLEFE